MGIVRPASYGYCSSPLGLPHRARRPRPRGRWPPKEHRARASDAAWYDAAAVQGSIEPNLKPTPPGRLAVPSSLGRMCQPKRARVFMISEGAFDSRAAHRACVSTTARAVSSAGAHGCGVTARARRRQFQCAARPSPSRPQATQSARGPGPPGLPVLPRAEEGRLKLLDG